MLANAAKIYENYSAWKEKITKTDDDVWKFIDFGFSQAHLKGSIYEDDSITQLIRLSLAGIKAKSGKSNVLIIDDFDRLDPEHIFRILNILSVHQNHVGEKDKFGFDKIIVVCSVNNIKKIFEHKYGMGTSFEGYIKNFYSTDIFHFNNQLAIAHFCRNQFSAELDEDSLKVLGELLAHFVRTKQISIRSIVKHARISPIRHFKLGPYAFSPDPASVADNGIIYKPQGQGYGRVVHVEKHEYAWSPMYCRPVKEGVKQFFIESSDFPFLRVIQILSIVFGDYNAFKRALGSENANEPLGEELAFSIIRSMAALLHVVQCADMPHKLFCRFVAVEARNEGHRFNQVDHPQSEYIVPDVFIDVGWNTERQYDGTTSYYSLVHEMYEKQTTPFKGKVDKIGVVLQFMGIILGFLEHRSYLGHLGLTK